ncbi:MAG: 1-deoxy-D-xylulose-5-phosphate reductoisomerase [Gammaproteobacteria bacterium]|jgi:1-deoxy-D-xylulose-5-phosphate reductoisomerase|nr:1-deoxy-D-xylulose-5-phosphate reductoisomerase [Gammaproteobacteria bacterium]
MGAPIGVTVLGSTGTIGDNTLDVIARHPDRFRVVALGAHRNATKLLAQCRQFKPAHAVLVDAEAAAQLQATLRAEGLPTEVHAGGAALDAIATLAEAPYVMAGIVGAAGLASSLAAARAGKRLMIANKEPLVMAGSLFVAAASRSGATLLPIDSEHNAIFQCWPAGSRTGVAPAGVRRILLTASGGPFVDWTSEQIAVATPEQACKHPKWVMGRKISVDSATLMNKGLEVIEARILFGLPLEQVEVVVHRQSLVHSIVEYIDGSMLAQLGSPDMRTPIAYALGWPERLDSGVQFLDLMKAGSLQFEAPDMARFPCLRLAREAAMAGGLAPTVLNAANEVAVAAFLEGRLNFAGIARVIEAVLAAAPTGAASDLGVVLAADTEARESAMRQLGRTAGAAV